MALVLLRALAAEDFHVHHRAFDARRAVERSVAHVAGLLPENRAQQLFLRRERGLALRRHLAHEDIARLDHRPDADHAALIEVAQKRLADVGNVARHFFRTQLCVARFDLELLDVDRGVVVVLHEFFADQDRVFEVVPAPRQERHQHVPSQRQLAAVRARSVGQHLALLDAVAHAHQWLLVDARVLVRALELRELVDVCADFAAQHAGMVGLDPHDDAFGVHLVHNALALAKHDGARVARRDALHACPDQRRFPADQRHGLPLHVRAHQRAVGVVVLEERNQAGRHRDQLLWRNVHVVHFLAALQHEVARLPAVHEFRRNPPALIERNVRLRHHVLVLFPSRKVEAVRLIDDLAPLQLFIQLFDAVPLDNFTGPELAVPRIHDLHKIDHAAVFHLAVGRLDEAVVVDPREAGKRADQTDVRTFGRLDRADAAVVRRMHIAHFESRPLARQSARPQRRKPPLVRDLAQRVGLVHELAELRTPEELADRRHHRLGVHQVVRHRRGHLLVHAHLFLDGALHAHQPDAELVFQQLPDRAHAPVAEVIDVVHHADVLAQPEQVFDRHDKVRVVQRAVIERRVQSHLDVELQPAHAAEIVFPRIEKHSAEQVRRRLERRRVARPQLAVNFDQRLLGRADCVLVERARQNHADVVTLREKYIHFRDARLGKHFPQICRERLVGFEQDFARLPVDHVRDADCAFQIGQRRAHLRHTRLQQLLEKRLRDPFVRSHQHFVRFRVLDLVRDLPVHQSR